MEAAFANINTSIRGVNKPGQIMESIVDFEQYQKNVGTTDIFTRSADGAISFFTINRRWQECNWCSIPLKADWTTYNKIMIIGQRGSVMCCIIDTGVLERLLRLSGIYCGFIMLDLKHGLNLCQLQEYLIVILLIEVQLH